MTGCQPLFFVFGRNADWSKKLGRPAIGQEAAQPLKAVGWTLVLRTEPRAGGRPTHLVERRSPLPSRYDKRER